MAIIDDERDSAVAPEEILREIGFSTWSWQVESGEVRWSDNVGEILGCEPADYQAFRATIHSEDVAELERALLRPKMPGDRYYAEFRVVAANGECRWLESRGRTYADRSGRPVRVTGLLAEVSAERHAEAARRLSEESFAKVFHGNPDAITINSVREGRFIDLNESFQRVTGYARDEAIGRTSAELELWVNPAERAALLEKLDRAGRVSDHEVLFRHRSGRQVPCLVSAEVIEFRGAKNLLMMVRDITARKRAEEERAAMIRELELKNAELERFAYTLSHDLKTPLVTIRGFLGLLDQDLAAGDADQVQRDLARLDEATSTMSRLVEELLELSRIGRVLHPLETVALSELVRKAAEMASGAITEAGAVVDVDPDLPVVRGDRQRLLDVFINLIDNAVKFMGSQPRPRVEIGWRRSPDGPVIYVRDNGIGIAELYHEKIFGLFDRLNPKIEGTGVGLAMVQRIIELHGGRVWVESAGAGQGSTFCLTLDEARDAA